MAEEKETKYCPCCGRHCDLREPHCEYGEEYLRTGIVVEKKRRGDRDHGREGYEYEGEGHEHGGEGHEHGGEGHEHGGEDHGHGRKGHGYGREGYEHERENHEHGREGHGGEDHGHGRKGHEYGREREHGYQGCSEAADEESRLVSNLRNLGHMMRFLFGGKGGQKRILSILCDTESITQRELTEKMGIQAGSASEVIGKLESAGLIVRTESAEDRRTSNITLTELGKEKAQKAVEERQALRQEMFVCLTPEERNILLELTDKLTQDWRERFEGRMEEDRHSWRHGKGHGRH